MVHKVETELGPGSGRRPARRVGVRGVAVVVVIAALALAATPAYATYSSGGNGSASFTVQVTGVNATWSGWLSAAPGVWNNSGAGANIAVGPSNQKKMTAGNYPSETWLGLYSPSGTRANRTFLIQVNAAEVTKVDNVSPGSFEQWVRWTTIHELGHSLSLADNPVTTWQSIMKYPSASVVPYQTPKSYDVNDVLAIY